MLKVSRILTAVTFYHGRGMTRPYIGKYLFLTSDPAYASRYSQGGSIQVYELNVPISKIFSLRKADNLEQLVRAMNNPEAVKSMMNASTNGELDWAAYSSICSEEFGDAESLLESLGFRGIWLSERADIDSVLLFDQHDANLVDEEPAKYIKPPER